jgi:hypothetical protein
MANGETPNPVLGVQVPPPLIVLQRYTTKVSDDQEDQHVSDGSTRGVDKSLVVHTGRAYGIDRGGAGIHRFNDRFYRSYRFSAVVRAEDHIQIIT